MHTRMPWRKRPRVTTTSTRVLAPKRPATSGASSDPPADDTEEDDVGRGETHDEGYRRLGREMGVAEEEEEVPRCSGFRTSELHQPGRAIFENPRTPSGGRRVYLSGYILVRVCPHEAL